MEPRCLDVGPHGLKNGGCDIGIDTDLDVDTDVHLDIVVEVDMDVDVYAGCRCRYRHVESQLFLHSLHVADSLPCREERKRKVTWDLALSFVVACLDFSVFTGFREAPHGSP